MPKKPIRKKAQSGANQVPIEDYRHEDKKRKNNPPVGMVQYEVVKEEPKQRYSYDPHLDPALQFDSTTVRCQTERLLDDAEEALAAGDTASAKAYITELKRMQEPWLQWAGKAEHTSFDIDPVSLYIHERISTQAVLRAVKREEAQKNLFADPELSLKEAVEFYQHDIDWTNRLILGDSLLVMNSLVQRELMAGKVQMIYLDPPYGIKFNSNFQSAVDRRDVRDGKDEDLTREPEMIKAYRDTWRLGIHSYLTYMRDRLFLCRDLLHDSGSIFIQISDENLHRVQCILDEVFGSQNAVAIITFQKTGAMPSSDLSKTLDFILWYAKDKEQMKFRALFEDRKKGDTSLDRYDHIEFESGDFRRLNRSEITGQSNLPDGSRFRPVSLFSPGETIGGNFSFSFRGQEYRPISGRHWATSEAGIHRLMAASRLILEGRTLRYKRYLDDFPVIPISDRWESVQIGTDLLYVVQTAPTVISRCLLMTTDPGDLVLDPTCGSGTTAYVAEQWGRRWITCDTSRVALFLARQRLMTAKFDYFKLEDEAHGIMAGFKYKSVPHITLKSIAQNPELDPDKVAARREAIRKRKPKAKPEEIERMLREENEAIIRAYADEEVLYDQPEKDSGKVRVAGPFTVEAIPPPSEEAAGSPIGGEPTIEESGVIEIVNHIETLTDLMRKDGVLFPNNKRMKFATLTACTGGVLHADGEPQEKNGIKRVAISFGPLHGPVTTRQVEDGLREAYMAGYDGVIFCGFAFDGAAQASISANPHPKVKAFMAHIRPDVLMGDLLKNTPASQLFTVFGEPDIKLKKDGQEFTVELCGVDVYDPLTGQVISTNVDKVAAWFLDTDYDGRTFLVCQAFFPDRTAWGKLAKALKGAINEEKFEQFTGSVSLPFKAGEHKRIAVKVIDRRGNEVMVTRGI